jgi:hypothetical protein
MELTSDNRFYLVFGQITAVFAHMEADIRRLISGIAFRSDQTIASAFLDSSQLAANLTILRKLARKFWDDQARIEALAASVERLRPQRNLFIHGLWSPGTFGQQGGAARVMDLKTRYEVKPSSRMWSYGGSQSFSLDDFRNIHTEIISIITEIESLMQHLEDGDEIEFGGHSASHIAGKPVSISLVDLIPEIDRTPCEPTDDNDKGEPQ